MKPVISIYDVFTPTKPATYTFVERDSVNERLVDAIRTPGRQIVVYGHSGSGKTTLLSNKLNQLYSNHITTRCMKGMSFESIVLDAFEQLAPFYIASGSVRKEDSITANITCDYLNISSALGATRTLEESTTISRALPPQLTPQLLAKLIGSAKCCWVLEDFHKVSEETKRMISQTMKVFMDVAAEQPTLKIIAIGAVDSARQVVQYDPEMRNRVSEIHVPLMEPNELEQILNIAERYLNLKFTPTLVKGVVHYSNGVASVCHNLGLYICQTHGIEATSPHALPLGENSLQRALERYVDNASDTLKLAFDCALRTKKATKYDNFSLFLRSLVQFDQDGPSKSELYDEVRRQHPRYPSSNFEYCFRALQGDERGALIRYDSASGKLNFADPLYRAFALALFRKRGRTHEIQLSFDDLFARDLVEQLRSQIEGYVMLRDRDNKREKNRTDENPPQ
jgi:energy-coupling factor transporter ATP-binding protein EcfA2